MRLVVKGEAKGVSKCHQGAFHRVGFGLFDCAFVGQAEVNINAVAGASPFADNPIDDDANLGDVGNAPSITGVWRLADSARMFGNHSRFQCLARPGVKAKNAISFLDSLPAFDIGEITSTLGALLDVFASKRAVENGELHGGECGHGATCFES